MTNKSTNTFYLLGFNDFYKGYKRSENPYDYELEIKEYYTWAEGWDTARENELKEEFLKTRKNINV